MVLASWEKPANKTTSGKGNRVCRVTGNHRGLIRKYGLNVGRRTFRELYKELGFKKYD